MRSLLFLICLLACGIAESQNLVPNPSFEDYSSCPSFASQLDRAVPWFNPNAGTPEYYNTCATWGSYMSLPAHATGGYQVPRTGEGFAGIYVFRTDFANMREYVEVELLSPLEEGKCYLVEFYVNVPNDHPFACDGIGAKLSNGMLTGVGAEPFPVTPDVQNETGNIITDTLGWTRVHGYVTANGGENHITIGNFSDDTNTSWTQINTGVWYQTSAYLYVDDVRVEAIDLEVDLGPDQDLCEDESIELDASTNATAYEWNDGFTEPIRTVSGGYYMVAASLDGCIARDTVVITTTADPTVVIVGPEAVCEDEPITLNATTESATGVIWSTGEYGSSITVLEPGQYSAQVQNRCGTAEDEHIVKKADCFCEIYVPTAFTPNSDGINDGYRPLTECGFETYRFSIHNRSGEMIFDTSDPTASWNGQVRGLTAKTGVYTWQLSYETIGFGKSGIEVGKVVLIK